MTQRTWPGTGGLPAAEYDYPRRLTTRELVAAGAVGVGAGLAAFYVARVLAARTPLNEPAAAGALHSPVRSPAARAAERADPEASLHPGRKA